MKTKADKPITLPIWWFIIPAYLTLWTVVFSIYGLIDGNGMMKTFKVDTGGASDFIMLNSAGRYVALAVAIIFGIWLFRTFKTILTALLARLIMDSIDLYAGIETGIISDMTGVIQSLLMFLLPNIVALLLLFHFKRKHNAL